jgi:hypothetical protein
MKRSEMLRNVRRSGKVKNGGRSEKFMLNMTKGLERLQNHVYGTFTFTLQKLKNHCKRVLEIRAYQLRSEDHNLEWQAKFCLK